MQTARTAATTFPLLVALIAVHFDSRHDVWLAAGCGIAAVLAIVGALIMLPHSGNRVAMALLTAAGVVPVWCVSLGVDRVIAALMAATLSAALLAIVLIGLPGVTGCGATDLGGDVGGFGGDRRHGGVRRLCRGPGLAGDGGGDGDRGAS
jgi:hypothetical protein